MDTIVTQTKKFNRDTSKSAIQVSRPKDSDTNSFVQWLLFKPQLHAVEPFRTHEGTRTANTVRVPTQWTPQPSGSSSD